MNDGLAARVVHQIIRLLAYRIRVLAMQQRLSDLFETYSRLTQDLLKTLTL